MVLLGIKIKINNGIINYYSKPFVLSNDNNTFVAQLLRDIDFSFILKKNDIVELEVLIYPDRTFYQNLNSNNVQNHNLTTLGIYNFMFNNFNENYSSCEFKKTIFQKNLNNNLNVDICFSVIYIYSNDEYIISTPSLSGSSKYLE
jgi:hypothetical protein